MIDGLRERFQLEKFVSKSTIDHVHKDEEIKLGGEKKNMTVLFSDIRGFTSYSESKPPELVMERLNKIMQLQANIVLEYGGDVDKYVGDEMFAVFEGDDMVIRAVKAAEDIKSALSKINETEDNPLHLGIGINTGEMISGNMGSLERIDRTVIGDAVNLGARLCSHAGPNTIILSEYSYAYVRDAVIVKEHDPIHVKGKEQPVKIYILRKTL
jgi:adenylate cyclase